METVDIESELAKVLERNKRVESDKAWEVSWVRRLVIAVLTYVVAVFWLITIHETLPLLKAVVPVAGYLLSTLSLSFIKSWWLVKH